MVSTFTTTLGLEEPGRGDQVGTWDTPVNSNMSILDNAVGGITTLNVAAGSVVLSTTQYRNGFITFNSTLIAAITITFPIGVAKTWTIENGATGSSAFTIALATTAAAGQAICCPPGEVFDVKSDGTNLKFRNFDRVGSFLDLYVSSTPTWISSCTVPPYLYCNGGTFSSATYPALNVQLGSTTLPDFRGRIPGFNNDGTARMTAGGGGVDGNTNGAAGGAQTTNISSVNLPNISFPVTDPGHFHAIAYTNQLIGAGGLANGVQNSGGVNALNSSAATTGITVNSGGSGTALTNLPPMAIGGMRFIRAA